jgi:hypothetical protein
VFSFPLSIYWRGLCVLSFETAFFELILTALFARPIKD